MCYIKLKDDISKEDNILLILEKLLHYAAKTNEDIDFYEVTKRRIVEKIVRGEMS